MCVSRGFQHDEQLIHVAGKTEMFPDDRQSYKLSVYENELHELSIVELGLRPAQRCGVRRAHQMINTAQTNTFGNVWDLKKTAGDADAVRRTGTLRK